MEDDRLQDRHVVVTGGARGIGRGIATRVARAGADVTIFDVKRDEAESTADRIREQGVRAAVVDVDVSDEADVISGIEAAVDDLGAVHGLVNNAGVQDAIPLLETTENEWDKHAKINAKGSFFCAKHVAQHMIDEQVEGAIVNIASTAAERPFTGQGAYAASKAAVVAMTIVLAKELGDHDIRVNAINPGTVDTPMVQQWLEENAAQTDMTEEELLESALEEHTLDRMGDPEEIGHVATLLLSDEGAWITGETVNVDAGYTSE